MLILGGISKIDFFQKVFDNLSKSLKLLMPKSGSTVIVSAIVLIAIVAIIAFIFLLFVFLMTTIRRKSLNNAIKKLLDDDKNDKLQVSEKRFGKMYQSIKKTWDRRAETQPIPELNRLQPGWIHLQDNKIVYIRDEIIQSTKIIEEAAKSINADLARKPSMTMPQYLNFLVKKGVGTLTKEKCEKYLSFYNPAKFGAPNINYTVEDYSFFSDQLNKIVNAITKR